jgi:phenylacetate-CoA ligase
MSSRLSSSELVQFAAKNSPYYRELYEQYDLLNIHWESLPIVDLPSFWRANSYQNNHLLTEEISNGVVFRSGGTTGTPKFSIYTQDEWNEFTTTFGQHLAYNLFHQGDRVANLFYAGHLYASFLFIQKSLESCPTKMVHFPISGNLSPEEIVSLLVQYQVNVLAVVPSTLVNMVEHLRKFQSDLRLSRILYGGEELYDDQRQIIASIFPKAEISSIGYASVDAGHLGYVDRKCLQREHLVFSESSIMEIINPDSGEVIRECGKAGRLIYTNLTRTLMPIIRYPVGDMATWVDGELVNGKFVGQKFRLEGRSEDGARVGPVTINRDDIVAILKGVPHAELVADFQMIITRESKRDQLELVLGIEREFHNLTSKIEQEFIKRFYQEREMFKVAVDREGIMPLKVRAVAPCDLERNTRTGKMLRVMDRRLDS